MILYLTISMHHIQITLQHAMWYVHICLTCYKCILHIQSRLEHNILYHWSISEGKTQSYCFKTVCHKPVFQQSI